MKSKFCPSCKMKVPSIDRVDDYKGYSFDNIKITTWQENNNKHYRDRKNGINNKKNKTVYQYSLDWVFIDEFYSISEASRRSGVNKNNISSCVSGNRKTAGGFHWKDKPLNRI